jgi:hypothetical protein
VPSYRTATVTEVLLERPGLQRVATSEGRAYALTTLTGPVAVGDEVVLNTTAVELGLGTGGWHVVHWNLARRDWHATGGGHIVKLRYTSLQTDTGAAEEHHPDLGPDLGGMPVVACTVHSQVAVVAAVVRHLRPAARIAYVMTDGAALPIVISDLVHTLRQGGVLDATVTAGHAFGGGHEAVTVASALTVARHLAHADVVVAGMGPGVVGTASTLGTTAVDAAAVLDAAAALGATPILAVRASDGDARPRHQGVSHHVDGVLALTHGAIHLPVPAALAGAVAGSIVVDPIPDAAAVLAAAGVRVTTMGRGPDDDPLFFAAAAAAGALAAELLGSA